MRSIISWTESINSAMCIFFSGIVLNDQSVRLVGALGSNWNCAQEMLVIPIWMAVQLCIRDRISDVIIGVVNCWLRVCKWIGRMVFFSSLTMDEQNWLRFLIPNPSSSRSWSMLFIGPFLFCQERIFCARPFEMLYLPGIFGIIYYRILNHIPYKDN